MTESFKDYMVSIRFMVYNNEDYIREALDGIFMQETNFKVEIVVGDDFSTDETLNIIREYKSTDKIHLNILNRPLGGDYYQERKRLGRLHNFQNIIDNCNGKYIALLDGDDYWTDSTKLQMQVDFMEENLDFSICFHNAEVFYQNSGKKRLFKKHFKQTEFTINDLIGKNTMPSASILFRRQEDFNFPNWFTQTDSGDIALISLYSQFGKSKAIDRPMSVYRKHAGGISQSHKSWHFFLSRQTLLYHLNRYYNQRFHKEINTEAKFLYRRMIFEDFISGRIVRHIIGIIHLGIKKYF